jgi:ATP-dependent RNA helicase DeaD
MLLPSQLDHAGALHLNRGRKSRGNAGPRTRTAGRGGHSARSAQPLQPSAEPPDIQSFREWPLGEPIQLAIESMGIRTPTPIQRMAIGPVLEGRDVIAKAETGTGKTLAFGAPMMCKIDPSRASVLGLVLCPTRELAQQVASVLTQLGAARGIQVALIVGGEPLNPQVDALKQGAQVVVGTPGRILDLHNQRFLTFPWTEFAILDEADEMLEIGFIDDVRKILALTPEERQTLLFSATYPDEVLSLARESTRNPVEVATASGVATVDTIDQRFIEVDEEARALTLIRLIEQSDPDDVFLVFCSRRTEVDNLMRKLERQAFSVKALHGGFDQPSRFRVMSAFRTGEVKALVATDVASRGLDVKHVSHVINFSVPQDISDYTHRIGRTGRAGRSGVAITLVSRREVGRWRDIERRATWKIARVDPPAARRRSRPQPFPRDHSLERAQPRAGDPWPRSAEPVAAVRPEEWRKRAAAVPAPRPRQAESPPAARGAAPVGRQRRSMSTRERLAMERGQRESPSPSSSKSALEREATRSQRPHGESRSPRKRR